jgi:hypothetical protein
MLISKGMGTAGLSPADPVTVEQLRSWINGVSPRHGLRPELVDLIVCAWAVLHSRAWYRFGGPVVPAPAPGTLAPEMELRPERLPASGDWDAAVERAGQLIGVFINPYLTGAAVAELTQVASEWVRQVAGPAGELAAELERAYQRLGIATDSAAGRLATARAGRELVTTLDAAPDRVAAIRCRVRRKRRPGHCRRPASWRRPWPGTSGTGCPRYWPRPAPATSEGSRLGRSSTGCAPA